MSSHRSPYQTGSGLGLNTVLAYLNANPSSIKTAIEAIAKEHIYPKTVELNAANKTQSTTASVLFSTNGYTSISDPSSCCNGQGLYKAQISGTYLISFLCDPNISNSNHYTTIFVVVNGASTDATFLFNGIGPTGPHAIPIDLNINDTVDFYIDNSLAVSLDNINIRIAFIHT